MLEIHWEEKKKRVLIPSKHKEWGLTVTPSDSSGIYQTISNLIY